MYRVAIAIVLLAGAAAAQDRKAVEVDFEAAALGTVPKGWTVAKTGTVEGSEWKVVEDKTAPKGAKVLAQVAESPNAVFNLCVADNTNLKDVEVRRESGSGRRGRTQLATKEELTVPAGEWHALTIRMRGNEIVRMLDGKQYLDAKDDTLAQPGKVGLWTKADARTHFDDFRAKELIR